MATEVTSNTATEQLLVDIVSNLAVAIETNPYMLLMPMTLATSLAFMLPVATPPNAIAFSYNRITIKDMALSGIAMNGKDLVKYVRHFDRVFLAFLIGLSYRWIRFSFSVYMVVRPRRRRLGY